MPDPFLLRDPPLAYLHSVLEPVSSILAVLLEDARLQLFKSPGFEGLLLRWILRQMGEPVLEALLQRQDKAEGNLSRCNRKDGAAGVDDAHIPDLAALVTAPERAQEGLALVLVDEG